MVGRSRLPTRSWGGLFSLSCLNANTKECVWQPAFSRHLCLGSRPDQVSEDEEREAQETSLGGRRSETESSLVWFLDQQREPTWFLLVLICAITLFPPPVGVKSRPPQRAHESPKCSQGFSACFYLIHPFTPQIPTEHSTLRVGTTLGTGNTAVNETEKTPSALDFTFQIGKGSIRK